MGGARLGRYTVLRHLASGGMADVLLARADGLEGFERHVVLKRIRAEHAKDKRFITMFLDEARLAASLHHQNIVQVHDIGESSGEYYFAMEYIHGEDLRKVLSAVARSRTHMPLGLAIGIISAVAAGLHYAHERRGSDKKPLGIVHRDVSPSNILIGHDGSIKIVDFGIAKAAMRSAETRSGSLKGKVSYMSPEQCKGESIDRRSDVYSLGVVLYELATTTRLFKGDNDYLVMDAIVQGKVPLPRVRRPDLPNALSMIIMRALAPDPARRFQSADELRKALEQFALEANLAASSTGLHGYMHRLFGDKPEPWLNASGAELEPESVDDAPTAAASKQSWTELPPDEAIASADEPKTGTDGSKRRPNRASTLATADTILPPMGEPMSAPAGAIAPERTTGTKLGWEKQTGSAMIAARKNPLAKGAMVGLPCLAIAGVLTWHFALRGATTSDAPAPPAPMASGIPAPPVAATTQPAPTVMQPAAPLPPRVAGSLVDQPAPDIAPAPVGKLVPRAPVTRPKQPTSVAPSAQAAAAPPAIPVAPGSAAQSVAATTAPAPAPTPPAPEPLPSPPPAEVEAPIAHLSNATIAAIASDHAKQLSKCEGTDELHGEVSVTFQVDATGKVVKSQLSSSIKNTKVAGCILRAVQTWQFPKPPTGSAQGVYTMSYQ